MVLMEISVWSTVISIDSFFVKFKKLWQNGLDAELEMKTKSGQVSISLSLILDNKQGHIVNPYADMTPRSCVRRRARRAAQRQCIGSERMNFNFDKYTSSIGEEPIASQADTENGQP